MWSGVYKQLWGGELKRRKMIFGGALYSYFAGLRRASAGWYVLDRWGLEL